MSIDFAITRLSGVVSPNPKFGQYLEPKMEGFAIADIKENDGSIGQVKLHASAWLHREKDQTGYLIQVAGLIKAVVIPAERDLEGDGRPQLQGLYCLEDSVWWVAAWLREATQAGEPEIFFKMWSPLNP